MSRFRRVVHNIASGYVALGTNAAFALVSVPLALHYLSPERFALWALMASIGGYLSLIDLGMSSSVARLLIDHKDDTRTGTYGSFVQTGWLVLTVQGLLLLAACVVLAPWLASLLDITPALRSEFIELLRWQGVAWAVGFVLRIFNQLLYAHQRLDVFNYGQAGALCLNLVLLWWFFEAGQGVFSLVWAMLGTAVATGLALGVLCWRLGLFPAKGCWGRPTWARFQELFAYGKDLFLVALGGQLILASQTMIIARRLGLTQAAIWAVGTKTLNMLLQLVWRIYDASGPGFGEMVVRREQAKLLERYRTIVILSVSFAAFCGVSFALCNSLFIGLWTAGKITWVAQNDLLLGVWLAVSVVGRCHIGLISLTKELRAMRYIYFLEGTAFVLSALAAAPLGLGAIICCSIVCSLCFSCAYGVWRVARLLELPLWEVAWDWMRPAVAFLWRFAPLALALWFISRPLGAMPRLAIHATAGLVLGGLLFARYGIPKAFTGEIVQRLPGPAAWLLTRIVGTAEPAKEFASGAL